MQERQGIQRARFGVPAPAAGIAAAAAFVLVSAVSAAGCRSGGGANGGSYSCDYCVEEPEAIPADDNRPTGIYKGVITGDEHTGTIRVYIATDQSEGSCRVVVNGETMEADTLEIQERNGNVLYICDGDGFHLEMEVTDTGEVVSEEFTTDGVSVEADVEKETSESLVRCYEGTWEETEAEDPAYNYTGYWNFLVRDESIEGRYDGDSSGDFVGTLTGRDVALFTTYESYLAEGTLDGDTAGGTFDYLGVAGTWIGRRTL